jgi:hypothetical protein
VIFGLKILHLATLIFRDPGTHPLQRSDALDLPEKDPTSEDDSTMLRHNPRLNGGTMVPAQAMMQQQKLYHYAGPPSIQVWKSVLFFIYLFIGSQRSSVPFLLLRFFRLFFFRVPDPVDWDDRHLPALAFSVTWQVRKNVPLPRCGLLCFLTKSKKISNDKISKLKL